MSRSRRTSEDVYKRQREDTGARSLREELAHLDGGDDFVADFSDDGLVGVAAATEAAIARDERDHHRKGYKTQKNAEQPAHILLSTAEKVKHGRDNS